MNGAAFGFAQAAGNRNRSLSAAEANIRGIYYMHIFPRQIREKSLHRSPQEILTGLAKLEVEIEQGMKELEGMFT